MAKQQANRDPEPEFDEFAEDYDAALDKGLALSGEGKDYFADGRMRWLARRLAERGFQPESALDFGCGTGSATPFFFEHLPLQSLIGTDPSEKSLTVARETWADFEVEFRTPEQDNSNASFDLAFCNGVFHHIVPEERAAASAQIFRSLRPGGLFAFWENNPWNPLTRYAMSRVPFDADAILVWPHEARKLLRTAGFQIETTDYKFFFPRSLAAFRGLEPALAWLPLGGQYLVLAQKPEA